MNIKAIETEYSGYRFRSRLEARYATFFDALGLTWQYEREGFDLGGGLWYLPDFWLVEQQCWVEVKPNMKDVTGAEKEKAQKLSAMTGHPVYMVFGDLSPITIDESKDPPAQMAFDIVTGEAVGLIGGMWSIGGMLQWSGDDSGYGGGYDFGECVRCNRITVAQFRHESTSENHNSTCVVSKKLCVVENHSDRLMAAYSAARSARFEFGR